MLGKDKEVEELAARLESQQRIGQQDREARKLQQSQEVQELQDQIDELTSESRVLGGTVKMFPTQYLVGSSSSLLKQIQSAETALWERETTRAATYYYYIYIN